MTMLNRRVFIKNSSLAMGAVAFSLPLSAKKTKHLLSFSTLGCPKWTFAEIINFAAANHYDGIEIRGIAGELDLTKCADFASPEKIATAKKMLADKNLKIVGLGSSARMHEVDPVKRKANLDDAKKFIDLANQLNCPYVRVFPNNLPKEQDRKATLDLISQGLLDLGDYAKGTNVSVLMETHGEVILADDIAYIMKTASGPKVGLVWDFFNMWSVTKEPPAMVYSKIKDYIRHTHIKDAKVIDGKDQYVLLGRGEAPVAEAIASLEQGNYSGYYSFEWEKLWHPEIAEPEIAIADFPTAIQKFFKS